MRKFLYILACMVVFSTGAYVWRVKNTGVADMGQVESRAPATSYSPGAVVVEVGDEKITQEDIDWAYNLVAAGDAIDKDQMVAIPDLGSRYDKEMAPLRRELIAAMIERKVLFRFIQLDRTFKFDDPSRYTACMTVWQEDVKNQVKAVQLKGGKERLKSRLCELSILEQYLKERLFADLKIPDGEVFEYFKNHMAEFKKPETATIRHILLGDENDAKRIRGQAHVGNFAELAKSHSLAPEAAKGGKLGPYALGSLPTVFDQAFKMKPQQISDVLKSNYGYHLIMLIDIRPKRDLGLEDARPQIVKILRKRAEEEAYKQWVEKALAAIVVTTPNVATW